MTRLKRIPKATTKAKDAVIVSFKMEWLEELKVILIEIIRCYIKGGKLTDNMFKVQDYITIVIEIQSLYISLNISLAYNIISRVQIKGYIKWVCIYSFIINILLILYLVQEKIQVIGHIKGDNRF